MSGTLKTFLVAVVAAIVVLNLANRTSIGAKVTGQ